MGLFTNNFIKNASQYLTLMAPPFLPPSHLHYQALRSMNRPDIWTVHIFSKQWSFSSKENILSLIFRSLVNFYLISVQCEVGIQVQSFTCGCLVLFTTLFEKTILYPLNGEKIDQAHLMEKIDHRCIGLFLDL